MPSTPPSGPVPTPVPSNPLIPPGVGTPALGGREPTATGVAVEPRILCGDDAFGDSVPSLHLLERGYIHHLFRQQLLEFGILNLKCLLASDTSTPPYFERHL